MHTTYCLPCKQLDVFYSSRVCIRSFRKVHIRGTQKFMTVIGAFSIHPWEEVHKPCIWRSTTFRIVVQCFRSKALAISCSWRAYLATMCTIMSRALTQNPSVNSNCCNIPTVISWIVWIVPSTMSFSFGLWGVVYSHLMLCCWQNWTNSSRQKPR